MDGFIRVTWKVPGLFKADANKVAAEIEEIGPSASAEAIVEKAREESTELHKCFTWDDKKAAGFWRIHQARMLVCNIVVDRTEQGEDVPMVRYFHKAETNEGYQPIRTILRNEDKYGEMLLRCEAELVALKRKYITLSEYDYIWKLIS